MKKTILRILAIAFLVILSTILNTCTPHSSEKVSKNEISSNKNVFYFNKYVEYEMAGAERVMNKVHITNGSIEMYGDVVRINRTSDKSTYLINKIIYNENNQTYELYSNKTILEFDVVMKTLTTYEKDGSGVVYHINSTIKSNW